MACKDNHEAGNMIQIIWAGDFLLKPAFSVVPYSSDLYIHQ